MSYRHLQFVGGRGLPVATVYVVDGRDVRPLPLTGGWGRHNRARFRWGRHGVGADHLAHAILAAQFGWELADWLSEAFCEDVVVDWPDEGFTIDTDDLERYVLLWLADAIRDGRVTPEDTPCPWDGGGENGN